MFACVVGAAVVVSAVADARAHEGGMHVARTLAGQLKVHDFDFGDMQMLTPAMMPLTGFTAHEPMFEPLAAVEPLMDAYELDAGAKVFMEIVSLSPAFKVWDHDLTTVASLPGDRWDLGAQPFAREMLWHADSTDPAFDPMRMEYSVSFRLIDTGSTGYASSEVYTLNFGVVPAPGAVAALGLAGVVTARRRRA
jgi:hypothetical protein